MTTTSIEIDDLLARAVQHVRDSIVITDADLGPGGQRIQYVNPAMQRQTGYSVAEMIGRTPRMFQGERTSRTELDRIRASLEAGRPVRAELINYAKDGREFRVEIDITPIRSGGAPTHFLAVQRDITLGRRHEDLLDRARALHQRLAKLVHEALEADVDATFLHRTLTDAVQLVPDAQAGSLLLIGDDDRFHYVAVEGYGSELLDVSIPREFIVADFPGRSWSIKQGFTPHEDMVAETERVIYGKAGRASEIRATLGVPLWIRGRLCGLVNLDNFDRANAFDAFSIDMALLFARLVEQVYQQIQLSERLRIDAVTRLPTRGYGEGILSELFEHDLDEPAGFLLLDVDDLKSVNDAFGLTVGDHVMRAIGERVRRVVDERAHVTRWTGDEFLIVYPHVTKHRPVSELARELLRIFEDPFRAGEHTISLSGSVGAVRLPEHAVDRDQAIQHAMIALHHAKRAPREAWAVYDPTMRDVVARRVRIERDLAAAIERSEIVLRYQPRVDLRTGTVRSVEALARWTHEELGDIPPQEFISVAEQSSLIHPLGVHVLETACRQARAWLDANRPLRVSVNVSATELQRDGFVDRVRGVLETHDLPAHLLEIEITESTAMTEVRWTIDIVRDLREMGVRVSIDDFGTAYSSLNYLRLLPVAALKIDRSFVMTLTDTVANDPEESALVRGIVALAQSLRLEVVGEGVETGAQLHFLEELGVDEAQGFHIGRPVPAHEIAFPSN